MRQNPNNEFLTPPAERRFPRWTERRVASAVCVLLAVLVLAVFGRTVRCGFVNYDDGDYVYANLNVSRGLTPEGTGWVFTRAHGANWHPLTGISHMLDCQWYGLQPAGHHFTNVLLHAAAAVMLFVLLRRMTGALWPSAFVAAVFAVHPLRMESVAWVSERKDVLSGLFFMLTLWAYARWVEGPETRVEGPETLQAEGVDLGNRHSRADGRPALDPRRSTLDYALVLIFFTLGLMSKPMLVTLPFVLLLLDYWPLRRFTIAGGRSPLRPLVLEKIPLLALSAAICAVTLLLQMPAMGSVDKVPFPARIGNVLVTYVIYVWQMIYPAGLAVFYPYPASSRPLWQAGLSVLLLASVSVGAWVWRRKHPYLLVGWLWYVGMLVPVIGLVQVGSQSRADRYTYLPQIGLYFALAWAAAEGSVAWRYRRQVLGSLALVGIAALSARSLVQSACWRDSEALWTHALACTAKNVTAHNNLGDVLLQQGRTKEAIAQYQEVVALKPDAPAYNNLGAAFLHDGQPGEAIVCFRRSVELQPEYVEARDNLGVALSQVGQMDEAVRQLEAAVRMRPDHSESHYNLGLVLSMNGQVDKAIQQLEAALALRPDDAAAHANLAMSLVTKGRAREAVFHYEKSLEWQPDNADTCRNFAWLLATCPDNSIRNGAKAIDLAARAVRLSGGSDPAFFGPLAAAYAEAGRFSDAVATAQEALELALAQKNDALTEIIRKRIEQYRSGVPVRESAEAR